MQRFYAPAVVHEFARQPIEQFRMRRRFAARADVFRSREQALAEVRLPDAVHDDPRGRRTAPVHEPAGEAKPIARRVFRERAQYRGHLRHNVFTWPLPIAALENMRLAWHGALLQRERRRCVRPVGQHIVDFLVRFGEAGVLAAEHIEQFANLFLSPLVRRNGKNLSLLCGQGIHFQAEAREFGQRRRLARVGRRLADRTGGVRGVFRGRAAGSAGGADLVVAAGGRDGCARRLRHPFLRALRCGAQTEPAERVAIQLGFFVQLAAVTVAAAVFLVDRNVQPCAAGKTGDRLRALEDGAMFGVAPHRHRGRGPSAFLRAAVNRVGDAEAGRFHVRERAAELDLVRHRWVVQRAGFTGEFLQ